MGLGQLEQANQVQFFRSAVLDSILLIFKSSSAGLAYPKISVTRDQNALALLIGFKLA